MQPESQGAHPLLVDMNAQQAAAISAADGPSLVLAGPGSGKTAVLTRRIAWLIYENGVPPERIMAVTFTNKATDEMRMRLEWRLGAIHAGIHIGTFHRIAARLLRRGAERLGYRADWKILPDVQRYWMVRRILERVAPKDSAVNPGDVRKAISLAKNNLVLPDKYKAKDDFSRIARQAYQVYQDELLKANRMDVDDLLLQFAVLLRDFRDARALFQAEFDCLLIDEFQDTNLAQYEIVRLLAPPQNNIFVVGDEDQSIYAFRGADYSNPGRLRADFPGLKQFLLEQNYRSTQTILDAARALISHNKRRTPKALYSENGVGDRIQIYEAVSDLDEAEFALEQIQLLRERMRLRYGDFAILYRKNAQSLPLRNVFHLHDLPFNVVNTIDFQQRREVKDIIAMLRLAHGSDAPDFLKRLAEIKAFGISSAGMTKFLDWIESDALALDAALDEVKRCKAPLKKRQSDAFKGFAKLLTSWRRTASHGSPLKLCDQIIEQSDYQKHLEKICKEDWDLAERRQSITKLREFASAASRSPEPFPAFMSMVAAEKADAVTDKDKVALTTLHSAKGLEFPVVFIIGLNENVMPHVHERDGANDIDEERRLFYVGMTRAERRLFLSYTSHKGLSDAKHAHSEFLLELPDHLIEVI